MNEHNENVQKIFRKMHFSLHVCVCLTPFGFVKWRIRVNSKPPEVGVISRKGIDGFRLTEQPSHRWANMGMTIECE